MADAGDFVVADAVADGEPAAAHTPAATESLPVDTASAAGGEDVDESGGSGPVPPIAPGDSEVIVTVKLPSGKELPVLLGMNDHAGIIRQLLAELPETCSETSYELHLRATEPDTPPWVRPGGCGMPNVLVCCQGCPPSHTHRSQPTHACVQVQPAPHSPFVLVVYVCRGWSVIGLGAVVGGS